MEFFLNFASHWLFGVSIMCLLAVSSAFFSGSETAFFSLTRDELRRFQMGSTRQQQIAKLLRQPDRLLSAILFWNLLINLTYFTMTIVTARSLPVKEYPWVQGLFGVFSIFGIILFGEVIPKSLAVTFRKQVAELVSIPLGLSILPIDRTLPYLKTIDSALRRTFFPNIKQEPILNAVDLERAVDHSPASKAMAEKEKNVLHNILDLSEITAEVVMRPRGTYMVKTAPVSIQQLHGEIPRSGYIFLEAETGEIESAISLASISQIQDNEHLESAAEKVIVVPWCAKLADVLGMLRRKFRDIAVVINEFGEMIGVVTYEDILDTILDQQPSRTKRILRHDPVLEIAKDRYHVDGITTLRYLAQRLEISSEAVEFEEQTTLVGLLQERFERFPIVGDSLNWQDFEIRIINATEKGQVRVDMMKGEPKSDNETQLPNDLASGS